MLRYVFITLTVYLLYHLSDPTSLYRQGTAGFDKTAQGTTASLTNSKTTLAQRIRLGAVASNLWPPLTFWLLYSLSFYCFDVDNAH